MNQILHHLINLSGGVTNPDVLVRIARSFTFPLPPHSLVARRRNFDQFIMNGLQRRGRNPSLARKVRKNLFDKPPKHFVHSRRQRDRSSLRQCRTMSHFPQIIIIRRRSPVILSNRALIISLESHFGSTFIHTRLHHGHVIIVVPIPSPSTSAVIPPPLGTSSHGRPVQLQQSNLILQLQSFHFSFHVLGPRTTLLVRNGHDVAQDPTREEGSGVSVREKGCFVRFRRDGDYRTIGAILRHATFGRRGARPRVGSEAQDHVAERGAVFEFEGIVVVVVVVVVVAVEFTFIVA
mmetsp:Transcript_31530/g.64840  ORF Transcript_31530/g.64840 Transcript_31530/m.64840 type:complete len:292 (+) Transcript_31530:81-956(+)